MTDRPIVVKIPLSAWRVLLETLSLDAASSSFDDNLRRELRKAMNSVEIVNVREG